MIADADALFHVSPSEPMSREMHTSGQMRTMRSVQLSFSTSFEGPRIRILGRSQEEGHRQRRDLELQQRSYRIRGATVRTSSEIGKVLVPQAAVTASLESFIPELGHGRALSKYYDYIDDSSSHLNGPDGP